MSGAEDPRELPAGPGDGPGEGAGGADGLAGRAARRGLGAYLSSHRVSSPIGLLIFGFGAAAGFLIAFSGLGVIDDMLGITMLVFLVVLVFIGAFGAVVFLFRKPLMRRLFGFAETQLELFSRPLAEVARSAINRDPLSATEAARDVVHMALARYAWLSTRRWVITSLTALIAAMAALAGTALLYKQNVLLEEQRDLMVAQNAHIAAQNTQIDQQIALAQTQETLSRYQVQLAEAARNAQLVVAISDIAAELGRALDRAMAKQAALMGDETRDYINTVPVLDPLLDLDLGLIMRIGSASQAAKPYRFLETGTLAQDQPAVLREAMERRSDLPATLAIMAEGLGWKARPEETLKLNDRPASPERGQLLRALASAGIHNFEMLSFYQLDLSYAHAPAIQLNLSSFQVAELSYADFTLGTMIESDFGAASLVSTRFRRALIRDTSFSSIPGDRIRPPYGGGIDIYPTNLAGTDFSGAYVLDSGFREVNGTAAIFDGAALIGCDFGAAGIAASTFIGALLVDPVFDGADLRSVDFDRAIVAGEDFLTLTAAAAAPGTFIAERYRLDKATLEDAFALEPLFLHDAPEPFLERLAGRGLYRVTRIQPFEK